MIPYRGLVLSPGPKMVTLRSSYKCHLFVKPQFDASVHVATFFRVIVVLH